jgi:predicted nuclease of predicted toxin-antitoxin system
VSYPLLLDEMFSGAIARRLRNKGHDALAVLANPALIALPDEQILAHAASTGRALVTANVKDFIPLDARCWAASQAHAGLILVSAKAFPQDRSYTAAVTSALSALLDQPSQLQPGQVTFLPPAIGGHAAAGP